MTRPLSKTTQRFFTLAKAHAFKKLGQSIWFNPIDVYQLWVLNFKLAEQQSSAVDNNSATTDISKILNDDFPALKKKTDFRTIWQKGKQMFYEFALKQSHLIFSNFAHPRSFLAFVCFSWGSSTVLGRFCSFKLTVLCPLSERWSCLKLRSDIVHI